MKIRNKFVVIIALFLLVIPFVCADDETLLRPHLSITFLEDVKIDTIIVNVTNSSDDNQLITRISLDGDNPTFVYQPDNDLEEGLYTFSIIAEDIYGNIGNLLEVDFPIHIPNLVVSVVEPRFSVTSVNAINLSLSTSRDATCKYSFNGFSSLVDFDNSGGQSHRKEGLSIVTTDLFIECVDGYDKIYHKTTPLTVDTTNPTISVTADNIYEEPLETVLMVSSSEGVVCKYDNETAVFSDMTEFDDYDGDNESSYSTIKTHDLLAGDFIDHQTNRFYVLCVDKSGRESNLVTKNIVVDTSQSTSVDIHDPSGSLSDPRFRFNVTTNKNADNCQFNNESGDVGWSYTFGGGKTHISSSMELDPGSYTYYVRCKFHNDSSTWYVTSSTGFVIDNTAPVMQNVTILDYNDTGKQYDDEEMCAEWFAQDNESSISSYRYFVFWDKSTDQMIDYGTESPEGDDEYCFDVNLNNSQKYYIKVQSKNSVGLWGNNITSNRIIVDTSLTPAGCNNGDMDGSETDIDCGGSCRDCELRKNCTVDLDCASNYCNEDDNCALPKCNDDVRNGRETDIDCGGNCRDCEVGQYCDSDSDCKTNDCDSSNGKCKAVVDRCANNLLDVGETDTDCGGVCSAGCGLGEGCDNDGDCITSAECLSGLCQLKQADSDGDGILDGDDNCPDVSNADQTDVDNDGIGDSCDPDSDNDGLPDSFEQQWFDCITCANAGDDSDKDKLTNLEEYSHNTNPMSGDTDGDGHNDGVEIIKRTDPLDPNSKPGSSFWLYLMIILFLIGLGVGGYYAYTMFMKKPKGPSPPRGMPPLQGRPPVRPQMRMRRPMPPRPGMRMPVPNSKGPIPKGPIPKGPIHRAVPVLKKPVATKPKPKPKPKEESKPKKKVVKRAVVKKDIFSKLAKITKTEKESQVESQIKSLKLTDNDLKVRIDKLKKELKVKTIK